MKSLSLYPCPAVSLFRCFFSQTAVDGDRFEIVCDGCNIECEGCTIADIDTAPVCSDLLDHTDSQGGKAILETLILDPGYWRATNTSRTILACFHKEACKGGLTGDPEYCLTGYEGPCEKYFAVGSCWAHCSWWRFLFIKRILHFTEFTDLMFDLDVCFCPEDETHLYKKAIFV